MNRRLMQYLIMQCKKSTGFIGSRMIGIWNKTFKNMIRWGLSYSSIQPEDYILEIGCGGGVTLKKLSTLISAKGRITGIDISELTVKKAKQLNTESSIEILQSAVESLPFGSHSFHKVFAIQTHIYWQDLDRALSEIHRVLTTNGTFQIVCEKDKIAYHLSKYQNSIAMITLLQHHSYVNIEIHETSHWITYICTKQE